jgi:hypothetical protein
VSLAPPATPYAFISYASADQERVLPLVDALQRAGVAVWLDRAGIRGGASYGREIAGAIKGCAALVLMASPLSLASRNVRQEIALAWEYERPYVPLLLEPVAIPDDVKYWLTAAQWVEVLDRSEADWLPAVLAALAPLGIAPAPPVPVPQEHLAGRDREQGLLREKLADAQAGQGRLVLIGGEAGVGKTALAKAARREAAARGFTPLEGRCFDLAETPPYGPFIDLFARYRPAPADPAPPEAFARRGTVGAVPSQAALFVQVQDFLAALAARRPLVLLLDDLHWADPASLDLLRVLARSVADWPLLLLVTYRSDELTRRHPLAKLLPQLAREVSAARLDLGGLDEAAVRALVDARYALPEPDAARLTAYAHGRAEGNALFVGELLRALEERGALAREADGWRLGDLGGGILPTLLRQVIEGRVARLGEAAQRLLGIAAVIGHDVPLDVWAAAGEAEEETLLDLAERAEEAHLLASAPDGLGVRFVHALIREALYAGVPALRRRRLHRWAGEALAATASPDPDAVADHLRRAGDERAAEWLVRAGERAQLANAWYTAADRYAAALALLAEGEATAGERGWLRYRLGRMRRYTDPPQALGSVEEAWRLAEGAGDRALAATALCDLGVMRLHAGEVAQGLGELAAGVEALEALTPEEHDRINRRAALSVAADVSARRGTLVCMLAYVGRYDEALAMGARFLAATPAPTPGGGRGGSAYADARQGQGLALATLGRPEEARAACALARGAYRTVEHFLLQGFTAAFELRLAQLAYRPEELAERERLAQEGERALARARDAGITEPPPSYARLPLLVLEGSWAEARDAALVIARARPVFAQFATSLLGPLARAQGDPALAWAQVRAALPDGPAAAPGAALHFQALVFQRLAAQLALDDGDLPVARSWLAAHDRWLASSGAVLGRAEGQLGWAAYHRASGDLAAARDHATRARADATAPRQPLTLLAAHRFLGELATTEEAHADAQAHLAEALALAGACAAPYERALILLAHTQLHLATGDHPQAATALAEARAILEPLEAHPALARADTLAAALELS